MNLSENYRKKIIEEFQFIVKKMNESKNIGEALYYYTGTRALIQRIFNLEFDPHLLFIHFVLNNTYTSIAAAVEQIKRRTTIIPMNIDFFHKLSKLLNDLTQCIEKEELTYEVLEKISVLTYSITGNGHYLQQKGVKIIDF